MQPLLSRLSQLIHRFPSHLTSAGKIRVLGMVVLTGWLGGFVFSSLISAPADLNAASSPNGPSTEIQQVDPRGFAEIAKAVRPTIVHIVVNHQQVESQSHASPWALPDFGGRDFFQQPPSSPRGGGRGGMGMGSGVLISPDGHVVTNHHVVEGASRVTVTLLDKRKFDAQVLGMDPKTDLALVKIDGSDFPFLPWGDSSQLQIGEYVLAVGNPFGLTATVTQGIVSALGRGGMGITQYEDFIQTDAAINPGNSGGALVNTKGELVGINTAIFSRTGGYQGIGFAVPSSMAQSVYANLVEHGRIVRGFLGVGIQEVTPELAHTFHLVDSRGALVTDVKRGSPAERAGVKRGDTVVKYGDHAIASPRDLQREVMSTAVGEKIPLLVMRDGEETFLTVRIMEQSKTPRLASREIEHSQSQLAGLSVDELTPRIAQQLGMTRDTEGIVVTEIEPGSSAERAGLVRGDVIREVNRKEIRSLADYQRLSVDLEKGQLALLLVERKGASLFLSVKV